MESTFKPYYAVIFTNTKSDQLEDYEEMAKKMSQLASEQDGYLGEDSAPGMTISYWEDLESIKKWKNNSLHLEAQQLGKRKWYTHYHTRIALVQKEYEWSKD